MTTRRVYIIMRNDDPCALSDAQHERRVMSLFEKHGVPHVAAVVPRVVADPHDHRLDTFSPLHQNPDMLALLKEYLAKDGLLEVAQHGETHQTNRFHTSEYLDRNSPDAFAGLAGPWLPFKPTSPEGYSEFNGLPLAEQQERVLRGKTYLEEHLGVTLDTFIFPWNSYSSDSLRAVHEAGFRYVAGAEDGHPGPDAHGQKDGLTVLEACYWWGDEEDDFTSLLQQALAEKHSSLAHLSFHSWMLNEDDLRGLDAFLARYANHPDVTFITPNQIDEIPHPVSRCLRLRYCAARLHREICKQIWPAYPENRGYCVLSTSYYIKRLYYQAGSLLILRTLGLTGWLATSSLLVIAAALVLVSTWREPGIAALLAGLALLVGAFLFVKAGHLRLLRWRQHRIEGAA